jgi:hypothetical protein
MGTMPPEVPKLNLRVRLIAAAGQHNRAQAHSPNRMIGCGERAIGPEWDWLHGDGKPAAGNGAPCVRRAM